MQKETVDACSNPRRDGTHMIDKFDGCSAESDRPWRVQRVET